MKIIKKAFEFHKQIISEISKENNLNKKIVLINKSNKVFKEISSLINIL